MSSNYVFNWPPHSDEDWDALVRYVQRNVEGFHEEICHLDHNDKNRIEPAVDNAALRGFRLALEVTDKPGWMLKQFAQACRRVTKCVP